MKFVVGIIIGIVAMYLYSVFLSRDTAYLLFRESPVDDYPKVHVASFNSSDGEEYNQKNCEIARDLFQSQPGVSVRYWCERVSQ